MSSARLSRPTSRLGNARGPAPGEAAASEPDPLALASQLCFALYASSLAIQRRYREPLAALGLTYPQYLVMLVLWAEDGLSVSAVGARLMLDSGTLTPLLKRLAAQGLLERRRGIEDERRVELHLTPAGRALRRRALNLPTQMAAAIGCTPEVLEPMVEELHELRRALQDDLSGPGPAG